MSARPQFSLRTELFVMAMVCLAAATMAPLRRPPVQPLPTLSGRAHGSGDRRWKDLGFAIHAQSCLRLAACLVFPAVLAAGAAARGGYTRSFCLGALLPAAVPAVWVWFGAVFGRPLDASLAERLIEVGILSNILTHRITVLFVCMPCVGLICAFASWLLRLPKEFDAAAVRRFAVRAAIIILFAALAFGAMIGLPPSGNINGAQPNMVQQVPIRLALCLVFPAMIGVGAAQGHGVGRACCLSALLPALVPVSLLAGIEAMSYLLFEGRWEPELLFECRYVIALMWALIPVFGLTAACVYWLLRFGEAKGRGGDAVGERPG